MSETHQEGHLSTHLRVPLIEAQVAVSKLLQQCPLNNAFGCFVLEEVDQSMLQTTVLLGCRLLLGELIQARILLMEGLKEQWTGYFSLNCTEICQYEHS